MDGELIAAACDGDVLKLRELIGKGANIEATDDYGWTPLHSAAENGHVDVVHYLVEKGANIHAKAEDGNTPLHWAAENGNVHAVRYLVEKGANIEAKNKAGETAMDFARNDAMRAAMREAFARPETAEELIAAARAGNVQKLRELIEMGANIDATNYYGHTPLHCAAAHGHVDVVHYLVEKGANIEAKDNDGATAMDLAEDDAMQAALREAAQAADWRAVVAFLERHSLSQFAPALKSEQIGVTCLDDLRYIDEPGLKKPGMSYVQQKKFLEAAKNLPQKRARPDGHVDSEPAAQHPRHYM